ncbi:uncharacterized serine-rich protein C215.13-like [Argonauta hians]
MEGGNNIYRGSPDSPHFSRHISRLPGIDDIKRDLSNITDDSNDESFLSTSRFNTVFSSPSHSIDSGFQSASDCLSLSFSPDVSFPSNTQTSLIKDCNRSAIGKNQYPKKQVEISIAASPEENISSWTNKTPSSSFIELSLNDDSITRNHNVAPLAETTPVLQCSTPILSQDLNILATPPAISCSNNSIEFILNSQPYQLSSPSISVTNPVRQEQPNTKPKELVIEILKPAPFNSPQISLSSATDSPLFQTPKLRCLTEQVKKVRQIEKASNQQSQCSNNSSSCKLNKRPPLSYVKLIENALNSRPDKRMTLKEIYQWIELNHPYYSHTTKLGWKNSIRHDLSTSKCFVREPTRYYGSHWKLVSTVKDPVLSSSASTTSSAIVVSSSSSLSLSSSSSPSLSFISSVTVGSHYKSDSPGLTCTNSSIPSVISPGTKPKFISSIQPKTSARRKEPPLILPRPNIAPQTYALIPIHTNNLPLRNSPNVSSPLLLQLPSISNVTSKVEISSGTSISNVEIPSHQYCPLTSTPILSDSSPSNPNISVEDLLLFDQNFHSQNQTQSSTEGNSQLLPLESTEQHCSKRICLKEDRNSDVAPKKHQLIDHNSHDVKSSANKKNRRKQKFVLKEMNPLDSSNIEDSFTIFQESKVKNIQSCSNTRLQMVSSQSLTKNTSTDILVPKLCVPVPSLTCNYSELSRNEDQNFLHHLNSKSISSHRKPNILSKRTFSKANVEHKDKLSNTDTNITMAPDFTSFFDEPSVFSKNDSHSNEGGDEDYLSLELKDFFWSNSPVM